MEPKKKYLLKHFATVLRNRAKEENNKPEIDDGLLKFFSRKELIEVIKRKNNGAIPKDLDLVEMENVELLKVIGDEMFILSFIAQQWSEETLKQKAKKQISNSGNNKKQVVTSK